ncbi:hypothetical protein BIFADO_01872 [Bifidobacterium adolescentis L2-32]|uniref:Uncharacterized protein n=1 Tax=Bifidobacterium adolescentis L2-32 TaxID=411481 RepID=A7A7N3_BIFAD|nr:hypothetical protein BIFADO_01872 [Bifidobacterium adolescentis L2-32]
MTFQSANFPARFQGLATPWARVRSAGLIPQPNDDFIVLVMIDTTLSPASRGLMSANLEPTRARYRLEVAAGRTLVAHSPSCSATFALRYLGEGV